MSKIILQPTGNKDAREHYVDTIQNPVSINRISEFVNQDELNILKNIYSDGAYIWGVTPGTNLSNKNKWNRIERGDTALFSKEGHIFASGTVTYKIHNKNLALDLWDTDVNGATWEYVFFLDEIKQLRIPYLDFNRAIGYSDKFVIQGFNVLDEEKSLRLFESFDLRSDAYLPDVDEESGMQASLELDKLDAERVILARLDQGYLRKKLFNYKSVSNCSICGKKLNIEFLVCAHIKKRSKCDAVEKQNLNNVTPMCKFGCDELFERGYIIVENGTIRVINNNNNNNTDFVNSYLDKLNGKACSVYNQHNEVFFKWHKEFHANKVN